jgi:transglutaminase-like putative cysteine protease
MRFRITYSTAYRYSEAVRDNLNVLRVKPATTQNQTVDDFVLRVDPESRLHQYRDYFGSEVIEFGVTEPHEQLAVEARMHVTTSEPDAAPPGSWERVASAGYRSEGSEYLLHGELPPADGSLGRFVDEVRAASPVETVLAVADTIPDRFEYRSGSTFVGSTVADLLEGGAGVCQDFVHLGLMLLREQGVAARYVSGYLFAAPEDDGQDSVEVQTHAWIEALVPDGDSGSRWVAVDPTNRGRAGETHVKIGHGRHYQDVAPIRGVYRGPATSDLSSNVEMRRLNGDGAS